jgi:hypothetical protein
LRTSHDRFEHQRGAVGVMAVGNAANLTLVPQRGEPVVSSSLLAEHAKRHRYYNVA